MARRSQRSNPELIRQELVELLVNFKEELEKSELREKVLKLIPAHHLIRDLGSSLIPNESANSARDRILQYFLKYPKTVINGEELLVVSGIGEWARRVRELRVEFGWSIATGVTLKEMSIESELDMDGVDLSLLKPDDYILLRCEQDRDSSYRWNIANQIRKENDLSVRDKIIAFLKANVGKEITGEELRYVANNKTEWARRVRELRTEYGWSIVSKNTGRPELGIGVYILETEKQLPVHDRKIPDNVRRKVLMRDKHTCQNCGWSHVLWNPSDPRNLELHHVEHHVDGGSNSDVNLLTLCNVCHDDEHRKK